ncbi:hypothetical protein PI126_g24859 [Phytophthora idaei]|nr:hypothetical protein PI126_g24859 [Phytophthora idaei]
MLKFIRFDKSYRNFGERTLEEALLEALGSLDDEATSFGDGWKAIVLVSSNNSVMM